MPNAARIGDSFSKSGKGADELTSVANRILSETVRSVETYLIVAAAYLALSMVFRGVVWCASYVAFPRRRRLGTPI